MNKNPQSLNELKEQVESGFLSPESIQIAKKAKAPNFAYYTCLARVLSSEKCSLESEATGCQSLALIKKKFGKKVFNAIVKKIRSSQKKNF